MSELESPVSIPVSIKWDPTKELFAALAKAQAEIKTPKKTKKVDYQPEKGARVKYNYADLADIIDAYREPLSKNGLSIIHTIVDNGQNFGLETILAHESGGCISSWYALPHPKDVKPQIFGSELTYARRYSASSLIGIASEDDDDGQQAAQAKVRVESAQAATKPKTEEKPKAVRNEAPASSTEVKRVFSLLKDRNIDPNELLYYMRHVCQQETTKNLKKSQVDDLLNILEDKAAGSGVLSLAADEYRAEREMKAQPNA